MDRGKKRADSPPPQPPPPPPPPRSAYSGDLEAYLNFNALSLGGASSSSRQEPQTPRRMQLQQRYATPASPLMLPHPPPSQGGGFGQGGGVHPLMQQLQVAQQVQMAQMRGTQQLQMAQIRATQQASTYSVGEGSSSGGYFWQAGNGVVSTAAAAHGPTSDYAMLLAANRAMPLAADRVMPLAADGSSSDYVSGFGNGYANPFVAAAAAPAPVPVPAALRPPVAPRPCTLRASASQYQPIGAASRSAVASSSTRRYHPSACSSNHPRFTFSVQEYQENRNVVDALRANHGDPSWRCGPRMNQGRSPEDIRSEMLRGPMPLALVFFQSSAEHVIRLLEEGMEQGVDQYRLSALATIKGEVHRVMDDKEGCQVFIALMQACAERKDDIHAIVTAATASPVDRNGNDQPKTTQLLRVTRQDYGEASLRALIFAAAPFPDMCKLLTDCLVCESVMDHSKGDRLLKCCFTAMNYEDSRILIQFACYHASKMLQSASGSRCLAECFVNARGEELEHLEHLVLENATMIARGHYSNYFMQRVLVSGSEALKRKVVATLMADVVSLSHHQFGSYVVEACFLHTKSLELRHLVLSTFMNLPDEQLADVVLCGYGNYVVQKLVDASKDAFPKETILLARRIERLPEKVLDRMSAKQVMKVVKKLFPRQRFY